MTAALLKGSFMNFFRNPWAIIILVLLVVLLFGAGKLPGLARNVGKSMRIFKSEVEELRGEDSDDAEDEDRGRREQRPSRGREADARDDRRRADQERRYDPRDDEGAPAPRRHAGTPPGAPRARPRRPPRTRPTTPPAATDTDRRRRTLRGPDPGVPARDAGRKHTRGE